MQMSTPRPAATGRGVLKPSTASRLIAAPKSVLSRERDREFFGAGGVEQVLLGC